MGGLSSGWLEDQSRTKGDEQRRKAKERDVSGLWCFWTPATTALSHFQYCPAIISIWCIALNYFLKMTVRRSLSTFRLTGGRQKKYFSPFHFSRKKLDPFSTPGISQTQGLNLYLLHYREILFHWTTRETPKFVLDWPRSSIRFFCNTEKLFGQPGRYA